MNRADKWGLVKTREGGPTNGEVVTKGVVVTQGVVVTGLQDHLEVYQDHPGGLPRSPGGLGLRERSK